MFATGQVIDVYAVELNGNKVVGFVSNAPMEIGATYEFFNRASTHPSVPYGDLATTYIVENPNAGQIVESGNGNDVIAGGAGADDVFGGGGDDTFVVATASDAAGDVVVGGNGPDQNTDNDVLDLTGTGRLIIDDAADATDAGARAGTVTFENGEVLTFSQIETILTDPQNEAPEFVAPFELLVSENETEAGPAVTAVDNDGDALTYSISGGADAGLVSIDPVTGEISLNVAPDFEAPTDANGDGVLEVEVTVSDAPRPTPRRSRSRSAT